MNTLAPARLAAPLALALTAASPAFAQNSNVSPTSKFAWGENIGWINFRDAGSPAGAQGVRIAPTFMAGYAWSENVGYINFGNGNAPYANTNNTNFGVNIAANGHLSGYAWGENIGWINFSGGALASPAQPARYDFAARRLRGYAWGENIGWINLDLGDAGKFVATSCRADWNTDGLITTADITDYLSDWFTSRTDGSLGADFNSDGAVNTADITDYLSAWFAARAGNC